MDFDFGAMDPGSVPRIAFVTHLDGDPNIRPHEAIQFNSVRKQFELDEVLVLILTPDPLAVGGLFPGYRNNSWVLLERDGEPMIEKTEIDFMVIPDDEIKKYLEGNS